MGPHCGRDSRNWICGEYAPTITVGAFLRIMAPSNQGANLDHDQQLHDAKRRPIPRPLPQARWKPDRQARVQTQTRRRAMGRTPVRGLRGRRRLPVRAACISRICSLVVRRRSAADAFAGVPPVRSSRGAGRKGLFVSQANTESLESGRFAVVAVRSSSFQSNKLRSKLRSNFGVGSE